MDTKTKRILEVFASAFLIVYGTYGVVADDFVLPAKGGGTVTLYGYPAWIMYGALLCLVGNLLVDAFGVSVRPNQASLYRKTKAHMAIAGGVLFVLALVLGLVKHSRDTVCENKEILRIRIPQTTYSAVGFTRVCLWPKESMSAKSSPSLLIVVVGKDEKLPSDIHFSSSIWMNRATLKKIMWVDGKLFVVYQDDKHLKDGERIPQVRKEFPLPVMLVDLDDPARKGLLYMPRESGARVN